MLNNVVIAVFDMPSSSTKIWLNAFTTFIIENRVFRRPMREILDISYWIAIDRVPVARYPVYTHC